MRIIEKSDIDQRLQAIVSTGKSHSARFTAVADQLYKTGIRPEEALNLSLWSKIGTNEFKLFPVKNNLPREFTVADMNWLYDLSVTQGYDSVWKHSYSSLVREYNLVRPYGVLRVKNKPIGLYIFRHIYIWRLEQMGMSEEDIIAHMGWKKSTSYLAYKNSEIYLS